ncbi:hypothetical protein [Leucobacter massiliensis]|uniref:Uncharacterized protein n=1 Tax=Leucobacter massiliensis TaxID=1686285 RepID=A0A2S9QMS6_9MICO|nr:hypothetical protein [Leucobacter massiliensis]PRI10888.1 hypothetical protein B4915_08345 [Leucobacter massiliensis]
MSGDGHEFEPFPARAAGVSRFDARRQRAALAEFAADGAAFLRKSEGLAFIEQLYVFFVPKLMALAASYGYALDRDEAANVILERLLSSRRRGEKGAARRAAAAESPFGYLWACAVDWVRRQWGTRAAPLERAADAGTSFEVPERESPYTPLEEVVRLTFAVLAEAMGEEERGAVYELLRWLALNPPQRLSYEAEDRIAAHRRCPKLTAEQVVAVMKIARGARPNTAATSLMGQFLLDPGFRPSQSGSHARALTRFRREFRAGAATLRTRAAGSAR